jgi:hypothetical protein
LALAQGRFPFRDRRGWGLDAIGRVAQLLRLHRLALTAEIKGRVNRADFLWQKVRQSLRRLRPDDKCWKTLAQRVMDECGNVILTDPSQVRLRLIAEILVDTHLGFYNGRLRSSKELAWDDRAFAHLDHVEELLEETNLAEREKTAILEPAATYRCERFQIAGRWDEAIRLMTRLARRFPSHLAFQEQLASLYFRSNLALISEGNSEEICRRDAAILEHGISELQKSRADCPHALGWFEAMAHLHHLRAIRLANGFRPSQAMLAVVKALAYKPKWEEAKKSLHQIETMLENIQEQMGQLQSRMGYSSHVGLSTEGRQLLEEAERGAAPTNRYIRSGEVEEILSDWKRTRARNLWLRMGLLVPAHNWEEQAEALDEATDLMLAKKPSTAADLLLAWLEVVTERPDLKLDELDPGVVCQFFLRSNEETEDELPESVDPPAHFPLLSSGQTNVHLDTIPWDYWLFSSRDLPLKGFLSAAAILVVIAGSLTFTDRHYRQMRDDAFGEMQEAAGRYDDQAALAAADRFFAVKPLSGKDERDSLVEAQRKQTREWPNRRIRDTAYEQLLEAVRQTDSQAAIQAAKAFLEARSLGDPDPRTSQVDELAEDAKEWPNRRIRDDAFANLLTALAGTDDGAALLEAEKFLQARPSRGEDPRSDRVRMLYTEAFTRWFIGKDDQAETKAKARLDAYRQLITANNASKNP